MSGHTSNPILFPRVLYGTPRETRTAWAKVSRNVARSGRWESVLSDLDFVDASEYPGEIIVGRALFGGARAPHENHWRLYHCIDFESLYQPRPHEDIDSDTHARVIVNGMRFFWFTLAMLEASGGDYPSEHSIGDRRLAANFNRLVAESFLSWLDQIIAISPRLATENWDPEREVALSGRCWWLGGVITFLCRATEWNPPLDDWFREIDSDFGGDCIRWLIARQLVERTPDGLHVRRPNLSGDPT